jgi:hypothetical protein
MIALGFRVSVENDGESHRVAFIETVVENEDGRVIKPRG